MSPISVGILAVSLSIDAFIASVGKGAGAARPSLGHAARTGAVFGLFAALTPLLGWALGLAASQYVAAVDHWIAFVLLGGVGAHMILQAFGPAGAEAPARSVWGLILAAIGTPVDTMAVGVSLAMLEVNILVIALAIGATTMLLSSAGLLAGRLVSQRFGRLAEMLGGAALIVLGLSILIEHLA